MTWSGLADWWRGELASDPSYEEVVSPLLLEILHPTPGKLYMDVGCGDGRVMRSVRAMGSEVVGVELSPTLAAEAGGGVVVANIPPLPLRDDSVDGCFLTLVMEHLPDHQATFAETARVTRSDGVLAIVVNHPVWTAPDSTPITDTDGEILWRPGDYFSDGVSEFPAGESTITFHHRTMGSLLTAAADEGWSLERMTEHPHHDVPGQEGIPRLLACRWRLLP